MHAVLPSFVQQQTHVIPPSHLLHLLYKGFMAQQTNRVESGTLGRNAQGLSVVP